MPILERLSARNFRIIRELDLDFAAGLNVVEGRNGSGKTSLLEMIYLLGTGKSFRTSRAADYISANEQRTLITGSVRESPDSRPSMLGIEKSSQDTLCRIDGQTVTAASELARHFSVVSLDAQAFRIMDDGPAIRRSLIDRALFHVEPNYLEIYKRFHRALRSRNELLKQGATLAEGEYWNEQLAEQALALDLARKHCVAGFNAWVNGAPSAAQWGQVSFEYRQGWRADGDLRQLLAEAWPRDVESRTTQSGPHRAELKILLDGRPAANVVSRGQGKLLICALVAAQVSFIAHGTGRRPALLVDDIGSELDRDSCAAALSLLLSDAGQAFVTTIEAAPLLAALPIAHEAWFHVERGTIAPARPAS